MADVLAGQLGLLNPAVLDSETEYALTFREARPFRHVVIDDFIVSELCEAICAEFPVFQSRGAINEDGMVGRKSTQEKVR